MNKTKPLLIVVGWVILTLFNYYFMNFFILAFVWLAMILTLIILTIIQTIKTVKEIRSLSKLRIAKLLTFTLLFILTLYPRKTSVIIEKVDWYILEEKIYEIVKQVKKRELNPNVSWNDWVCQLPFKFPLVSNGGNDIGIFNKVNDGTTVNFWVFHNFFDSTSTNFVYTDD